MEKEYKNSECCRFDIRVSLKDGMYTFYVTAKDQIEALKIIYAYLRKGEYGENFISSFDSDHPPFLAGVEFMQEKQRRALEGNREFLENKYDLSYTTSALWWVIPEDEELLDHSIFHEWRGIEKFIA